MPSFAARVPSPAAAERCTDGADAGDGRATPPGTALRVRAGAAADELNVNVTDISGSLSGRLPTVAPCVSGGYRS